jgi:sporulation protein YlmC with PRC-barrel domain
MKKALLMSAALLMGASLAAVAETTPAQTDGAAMSPPASSSAHQAARAVDQDAATTPAPSRPPAGMSASQSRANLSGDANAPMGAPMGTSEMFTSVPAQGELSSKVVGLEVYNTANKDVGKIKDIAFDQNGVKAYIVAVGGFLGMGDRYVAVSPSAVNISYDSNDKKWHAAMNTDIDQLKAAPEYKYSSND